MLQNKSALTMKRNIDSFRQLFLIITKRFLSLSDCVNYPYTYCETESLGYINDNESAKTYF